MGYILREDLSIYNILASVSCKQNKNYSISAMWVMPISGRISHVVLFFPESPSPYGTREQYTHFKISSHGTFRGTITAAPHIWAFPLHVPDHCVWRPAHHLGCQLRLPPPHHHVLLPLQPVLCRHLLHLHHYPKDAAKCSDTEQSHNLWRLHCQDAFLILFSGLDDFILTVMAYDRFMAICHPLHYTVTLNSQLCGWLVLESWIISVLNSLLHSLMILWLSFCSDLEIHHFFVCEIKQLIQLACSDTFVNNVVLYFGSGILGVVSLADILYSYSKIVSYLRVQSIFHLCISSLCCLLIYCTCLGVCLSSVGTHSSEASVIASVMYTVVTPMLNPFIYSLRNKDIKKALKRFFRMETF